MAWLSLTMPNQTVKNGLKVKKIKLPQMNFFLKKQLIKFSCTYWLLSFCKILKKFLEQIQSYEDVPISGPKWPISQEQNFLGTNHYYYFHLPTDPFHCPKFKKLLQPIQNYEDVPFSGPKMAHLSWTKFFWYKPLLLLSSTYWPFSLCKIFKNSYSRSRVMRMCNCWAQHGPFPHMIIFCNLSNLF